MSFETFAVIWPFVVAVLVVGGMWLVQWYEDRAERLRGR